MQANAPIEAKNVTYDPTFCNLSCLLVRIEDQKLQGLREEFQVDWFSHCSPIRAKVFRLEFLAGQQ